MPLPGHFCNNSTFSSKSPELSPELDTDTSLSCLDTVWVCPWVRFPCVPCGTSTCLGAQGVLLSLDLFLEHQLVYSRSSPKRGSILKAGGCLGRWVPMGKTHGGKDVSCHKKIHNPLGPDFLGQLQRTKVPNPSRA